MSGNYSAMKVGELVTYGEVGIGTTSPNEELEIYGDGIRIHDPGSSPKLDFVRGGTSRNPNTQTFGLSDYSDWRITADGMNLYFRNQWTGGNSGNLLTAMTLAHSTGYVGIGVTSPSVALDISGKLRMSSGLTTIQVFNSNLTVTAGAWNDIGDFSGMSNGCYLLTVRWGNSSNPLTYWYGGASGVIYIRGDANASYNWQAAENLRLNHWYHYRTSGEFEFVLDSDHATGNYGNTTLWVKSAASTTINFTTHMTLLQSV